jgi:Leucine-rich repeat (LRR) protein
MLRHVRPRFYNFDTVQRLGLGLRHLSIPNAQPLLAPLAMLHELRTLHMPNWRNKADVTQYLGHMSHLTELDLSNTWWLTKLDGVPTASLKCLNVKNTRIRRLLSMPNLEELDVSSCAELCMVISAHPKVRSLKMGGSSAEKLDFRPLTELQELDISGSDLIRFHVGLQLRVLKAESCENLRKIPDLPNLLELNVKFCHSLAVLPRLPNLLKLNNCGSSTCPNRSMVQLRELDASELTFENFECLGMLPRLEKLSLQGCEFVEQDFSKLHNLTYLNLELDASASLNCLPTTLTHLQLDSEVSDIDMIHLVALTNLKTLRVYSENITNAGMVCISRIRGL